MKLLGKQAGHVLWEILGPVDGRNRWSDGINAVAVVPSVDLYLSAPTGTQIQLFENTTPLVLTGFNYGPVTTPIFDRLQTTDAVTGGSLAANGTFTVAGDRSENFPTGTQVLYLGDTGDATANKHYMVLSSVFTTFTTVTVSGAIGDGASGALDGTLSGPFTTASSPRPASFAEGQRPDPSAWGAAAATVTSAGAPLGPVSYAPTIGTVLTPTWLRVVLSVKVPVGQPEGYAKFVTKWS